jgi:inorganic pyrophosphatase/exopolyphosphatase
MKVVTSGQLYADIDVYAGIIAFAELWRAKGFEAKAVTTAPVNGSVPQIIQGWPVSLERSYQPDPKDTYSIIDVSNPDFFEHFVDLKRVEAVIDHHVGFEDFWQERIGDGAHIEFIGAACTLVYEAWEQAGLVDKMTRVSAKLLACGILDNTLNFGAKVTSPRDVKAYEALLKLGGLDPSWAAIYFSACEDEIVRDALTAIKNDTKSIPFKTFGKPILTGQIAVWNGQDLISEYRDKFANAFSVSEENWMINLIGIGERNSYFITENKVVQDWLSDLLQVEFKGSIAEADRVWLRKELIKLDLSVEPQ